MGHIMTIGHYAIICHRPLCHYIYAIISGITGLKPLVYLLGQRMMCETIGFQGQGNHLCNQIPENNDNDGHGAHYRNGEV